MPKRKAYRLLVRELADVIDTIVMYAGDPIKPSNMRVFNMTPEIYDWVVSYSTKAKDFLDWRSKMFPVQPTALPSGEANATALPAEVYVRESQGGVSNEVPPESPRR